MMLYVTTDDADYLQDSLLYGLRKKLGDQVIDWPKKHIMYKGDETEDLYGRGFTLWKTLEDIPIDRENMQERIKKKEFDVIVFSSIFRQQLFLAHLTNFKWFNGQKYVFVDGEDDGFPTVYDAICHGTYFKRENPKHYEGIKILGLSIPREKMLDSFPNKDTGFTTHVQCAEAYKIKQVAEHCSRQVSFSSEQAYYNDLSRSKYGITMKKSGWDVPRHIENAGHYVVNCIYSKSDWGTDTWYDKPKENHPLGLVDGKNCIVWDNAEQLVKKITEAEKHYKELSEASRAWAETKTCEAMAETFLKEL